MHFNFDNKKWLLLPEDRIINQFCEESLGTYRRGKNIGFTIREKFPEFPVCLCKHITYLGLFYTSFGYDRTRSFSVHYKKLTCHNYVQLASLYLYNHHPAYFAIYISCACFLLILLSVVRLPAVLTLFLKLVTRYNTTYTHLSSTVNITFSYTCLARPHHHLLQSLESLYPPASSSVTLASHHSKRIQHISPSPSSPPLVTNQKRFTYHK